MKPIIPKLWMFIAMLCSSLYASAYDFEVNGLYYNILSEEERTVEVIFHSYNYDNVSGDIELPQKLFINQKHIP